MAFGGLVDPPARIALHHHGREKIDFRDAPFDLELRGVEGPRGVCPVESPDQALVAVNEQLAPDGHADRRCFAATKLYISLANVEGVSEDPVAGGAGSDSRDSGILSLEAELNLGSRLDADVDAGTYQALAIVVTGSESECLPVLEAEAEFST